MSFHGIFNSNTKMISTLINLGRSVALLCLACALFLSAGCQEPTPEVSPPEDAYPGPITVTLTIPEAIAIYYTLDGSEPQENCLLYTGPITISETTTLKYAAFTGHPVALEKGETKSVSYIIDSGEGGGGSGGESEQAILVDWLEYENGTRQALMDAFFGGCEPVVGCAGDLFSDLGTHFLCDDATQQKGASAAQLSTLKTACENAGNGWITWTVQGDISGGSSVFEYKSYEYTLTSSVTSVECTMNVDGKIVGDFDIGGSGNTSTGQGATIMLTGCHDGDVEIEDAVLVTNRVKSGGYYDIRCTATGCSNDVERFYVTQGANGPDLFYFVAADVEASCDMPFYLIKNTWNSKCMSVIDNNNGLGSRICNANDITQQWSFEPDTTTPATGDYKIRSTAGDYCITNKPRACVLTICLPWLDTEIAACEDSSPVQRFTLTGTSERVHIVPAPQTEETCLKTSLALTLPGDRSNNNIWADNCNTASASIEWGIYANGVLGAIDPATLPQD